RGRRFPRSSLASPRQSDCVCQCGARHVLRLRTWSQPGVPADEAEFDDQSLEAGSARLGNRSESAPPFAISGILLADKGSKARSSAPLPHFPLALTKLPDQLGNAVL